MTLRRRGFLPIPLCNEVSNTPRKNLPRSIQSKSMNQFAGRILAALTLALSICARGAESPTTLESAPRVFQRHADQPLDTQLLASYYSSLGLQQAAPAVADRPQHEYVAFNATLSGTQYDRATGQIQTGLERGAQSVVGSTVVLCTRPGESAGTDPLSEWVATVIRVDNDELARFPIDEQVFRQAMASAPNGILNAEIRGEVIGATQETSGYSAVVVFETKTKLGGAGMISNFAFKGMVAKAVPDRFDGLQVVDAMSRPIRYLVLQIRPTDLRVQLAGGKVLKYSAEEEPATTATTLAGGLEWIDELHRPIQKLTLAKKPPLLERKQLSDALMEAARAGDTETFIQALEEGALPNPTDQMNGGKAIDFILPELSKPKYSSTERVQLLEKMIGYGCDVTGRETVKIAASQSDPMILVAVIRGGGVAADYLNPDDGGVMWNSPLVQAAWNGRTDMARILLAAGASPDEKCNIVVHSYYKQKADDVAVSEGHRETAQLIRDFRRNGKAALTWSLGAATAAKAKKSGAVIVDAGDQVGQSTAAKSAETARPAADKKAAEPPIPSENGVYLLQDGKWVGVGSFSGKFVRKGLDLVGAFVRGAKAGAEGRDPNNTTGEVSGFYVVSGTPFKAASDGFVIAVRNRQPLDQALVDSGMALSVSRATAAPAGGHQITMVKLKANMSIPAPQNKVDCSLEQNGTGYVLRVPPTTGPIVFLDQFMNAAIFDASL